MTRADLGNTDTAALAAAASAGRRKPAGRGTGPRTLVLGAAGVAVLLVIWEVTTRLGLVKTSAFPPASEVLTAIPALLTTSVFWAALGQTLLSTLLGLLVAVVIAIPLGTLIGSSTVLFRSTRVVTEFLKPIPVVALLPLALLVFGITLEMKVFLIAFGALWPLLIQVIAGVQSVDAVASATARSFGVGPLRRFLFVTLPSAAPSIATGLRVAGVSALLLSVVTELVGRAPGLGNELQRAQSSVHFADMYGFVLITGLLGIALNLGLERAERAALHWHVSQRGAAR